MLPKKPLQLALIREASLPIEEFVVENGFVVSYVCTPEELMGDVD